MSSKEKQPQRSKGNRPAHRDKVKGKPKVTPTNEIINRVMGVLKKKHQEIEQQLDHGSAPTCLRCRSYERQLAQLQTRPVRLKPKGPSLWEQMEQVLLLHKLLKVQASGVGDHKAVAAAELDHLEQLIKVVKNKYPSSRDLENYLQAWFTVWLHDAFETLAEFFGVISKTIGGDFEDLYPQLVEFAPARLGVDEKALFRTITGGQVLSALGQDGPRQAALVAMEELGIASISTTTRRLKDYEKLDYDRLRALATILVR